jgi:hypothetical protein
MGSRIQMGNLAMTADLVRTLSTCFAAVFVSSLLVAAATSAPTIF